MAFPVVEATNEGGSGSATTSHTVNLPSSIASGELLIAFFSIGETVADETADGWPAGWTRLARVINTIFQCEVRYKTATGSEGASISVTTTESRHSSHVTYRVSGWSTNAPEWESNTTGLSTTVDLPSLTPTWGAKDTLWLAIFSFDDASNSVVDQPTNYTNLQGATGSGTTNGTGSYGTQRQLNAASEDPGTYEKSTDDRNIGLTIGIESGAAPTGKVRIIGT